MRLREIRGFWRIEHFLQHRRQRKQNKVAARRHDVEAACHREDFIYEFIMMMFGPQRTKQAVDYYFDDGFRSAQQFAELVKPFGFARPVRVLEFASGYGCVTRHLKKNPDFSLIACDIHPQACEVIQEKLGVQCILSKHVPEELTFEQKFDVVFALSFFSHMPRATWGRWIKVLFAALDDPGYLVFTTQRLTSAEKHGRTELPSDGFYFEEKSEQDDLSTAEYGATMVTPDFVRAQVLEQTGVPVFDCKLSYWWGHQDLWVVKKLEGGASA
jgi:cyclopropane fatty-acyl-phospholipid synthase-like methyltransferase